MATSSIDKGLYAAPLGIEDEDMMAPPIEIEIEDPESVRIGMGDIEIELSPGKEDTDEEFDANLAEFMDESALDSLGSELVSDFTKDIGDRKDWIQTYVDGLKLLGLKYEDRTEPWQGACGVFHPMLTESVVRFQSEGIMETFPAAGPVKTQILGKDTPEKEEASTRVREDMNYQLTDVMVEYRPEHEKLLWNLPLAGSAFKKVYYDPSIGRQVAMFIPAEDIVVPYGASNLERAERVTHVMRKTENEIAKLQEAGFYMDVDLGDPSYELDDIEKQKAEEMGMSALQDDRFRVLEMHVDLDLKGYEHENKKGEKTGIALPYVVTVEKATAKILAIRRNWYEGDELQLAQTAPQLYNLPLLHRQMIEVLGIKNAAKLIPIEDDATPVDPVQENQNALTGKPNKAFLEQDHQAHIAVHTSMLQNPKVMGLIQNTPQGQAIVAAMMAHINEHLAFAYRKEVEASIGLLLPTEEQEKNMSPEVAAQVAQLSAQASTRLTQQAQSQAAQQQAQQQAQDPLVQMQQQELQIKMQELQLKAQKQQIDAAAKADQLRIEESRIAAQKEIAAMQVGASAAAAKDKLQKHQQLEGAKLGVDIAKNRAQMAMQMAQRASQKPKKE